MGITLLEIASGKPVNLLNSSPEGQKVIHDMAHELPIPLCMS